MTAKQARLPKRQVIPKLTTFFFNRPRFTAMLWLAVTVFGLVSYTSLLRREGFPSVNIPLVIVGGTYFVNDPIKVDADVAKLISDTALQQENVNVAQAQSADNFFTVFIQYDENVDAKSAAHTLEQAVQGSGRLPDSAQVQYNVPYFGATGGDIEKIDVAISFFDKQNTATTAEIADKAEAAAKWLENKKLSNVQSVFVKDPYENVEDPKTGQATTVQRSFDRYGVREGGHTAYYTSVIIGVAAIDAVDVIELDEQIEGALSELRAEPEFQGYGADISASFAPSIEDNISELQRVLLEGLLAVLVVGSIVIAVRASLITVISMVSVLLVTLGVLYLIGYTLNVITLFALILGLSLIVDDTIIMVEAIDAARHHRKNREEAVAEATRKVSRAMVAATITASLSFAPLIFVGGILGSFIRAIPITIISALIISLLVALIFIPFFARLLLLGKKQMGSKGVIEVAAGFEARIASFFTWPMLWARRSRADLFFVGGTAVLIGIGFILGGLLIARNVVFNIFPPTKDTNGIVLNVAFEPGTTIAQAQAIAAKADTLAAEVIGDNYVRGSYYAVGSAQTATEQITITSYNERDITSPELVDQLQNRFDSEFDEAKVAVGQLDIGPPTAAFTVQVKADNREAAFKAANDLSTYLSDLELHRLNDTVAHLSNVTVSSRDQYVRDDSQPIVTVTASFDGTDTTTLVNLAQNAVEQEFTDAKLSSYGLEAGAISFDLGQEAENQESFRTLVVAFPILLMVMYVVLAVQFRSLLQPLLIFMAIPFSIFGVMLGLNITDNAISFFTLLGWFALVGLSIKNTILLTDFANQARRQGLGAIDSAVAALRERFRPLFATSMTAVVSLIPLALTSPFWEGLSVVLIFGLLSSTFLVVSVFPYYYLGAEFLRTYISARAFFTWLISTTVIAILVGALTNSTYGLLIVPLSLSLVLLRGFYTRRLAK